MKLGNSIMLEQGALGFIQVVQVATEKVKFCKFRKSLVLVQLVLTLEKQQLNLLNHAHQDHCYAPKHLLSLGTTSNQVH